MLENFPSVSRSASYSDLLKKQAHSFFDYANSVCIFLFLPSVNKIKEDKDPPIFPLILSTVNI